MIKDSPGPRQRPHTQNICYQENTGYRALSELSEARGGKLLLLKAHLKEFFD